MSDRFATDDAAAARLIAEHPLAWIVSAANPAVTTPMPLLLEQDEGGAARALIGHLPKAHPLVRALSVDPRALFLFQGPQGYISPEWLTDKDWAPTWNFAVAVIEASVTLDDALTERALTDLVAHMERDRAEPWTVAAMGDRFHALRRRVIGFRADITAVRARFKLGQDENDAVFTEILAGLGEGALSRWMQRAR